MSYYKVSISIKGTSLAFEFVSEGVEEGRIRHAFSESRHLPVLCGGLPGAPHGEEEDVETAKDILAPERAEQSESVNYIQNEMCNIDPAALEYPVTLYLVQLCDGSTMYILGDGLLEELVIESPAQEFSVVVTLYLQLRCAQPGNRRPLRIPVQKPQPGHLGGTVQRVCSPQLRLRRGGQHHCFEPKTIDNLSLTYDATSSRLNKVKDTAPADGRPFGFKPGADDNALYQHDANGNMTQSMFEGQSLSCKGQFFGDTALLFLTVPPVRSSKRRLPDTSCTGQVVSPENWLFSLSNPASKHALRPAQGLVDALQFP